MLGCWNQSHNLAIQERPDATAGKMLRSDFKGRGGERCPGGTHQGMRLVKGGAAGGGCSLHYLARPDCQDLRRHRFTPHHGTHRRHGHSHHVRQGAGGAALARAGRPSHRQRAGADNTAGVKPAVGPREVIMSVRTRGGWQHAPHTGLPSPTRDTRPAPLATRTAGRQEGITGPLQPSLTQPALPTTAHTSRQGGGLSVTDEVWEAGMWRVRWAGPRKHRRNGLGHHTGSRSASPSSLTGVVTMCPWRLLGLG